MHFGFFVGHCVCDWRFTQLLDIIKSATMEELQTIREHHLKFKRNPKFDKIEQALKERLG